jgi:branched-chain amino acid transport system permease protein
MYAGLAGVLTALVFGRIVPQSFGFALSVEFLVMIVIGGLGSVRGAALGAIFVSLLPKVLDHYGESLPLLAQTGSEGGIDPADAARLLYGLAILAVLMFAPGGLGAIGRRLRPPAVAADAGEATTTEAGRPRLRSQPKETST